MGLFAFLDQLHWYELLGGLVACIVLGVVAAYAFAAAAFYLMYYTYKSATLQLMLFLGVVGSCGWFIFHLIQKSGT